MRISLYYFYLLSAEKSLTEYGGLNQIIVSGYLPDFVLNEIKDLVNDDKEKLFPYKNRWEVNSSIKRVCDKAGIEYLSTHHVGSHTFATNLARMAGMDAKALTATGRWKDMKSTYHYTHYLKRQESTKADILNNLIT